MVPVVVAGEQKQEEKEVKAAPGRHVTKVENKPGRWERRQQRGEYRRKMARPNPSGRQQPYYRTVIPVSSADHLPPPLPFVSSAARPVAQAEWTKQWESQRPVAQAAWESQRSVGQAA